MSHDSDQTKRTPDDSSGFDQLLARISEGGLSLEERERLGALMAGSEALRKRYLEHCQMHAILRSEHGLLTGWSPPSDEGWRLSRASRSKTLRRAGAVLLAVAASIAVFVWLPGGPAPGDPAAPPRGEPVAVLTKSVGASFAAGIDGVQSPAEGVEIRQGFYELQKGLIEIEYRTGALLVLQGPSAFTLIDGASVRLDSGQVAAHIPEAAKGFRIDSPGAKVIDLGTDFGVRAFKGQNSEVHVFEGEVVVDLQGDLGPLADDLHLTTGQAARIDYLTGMPSGIDLDDQRFVRNLRETAAKYADLVLQMNPAVYYRMEPSKDGTMLLDSAGGEYHARIKFGRRNQPIWTMGRIGSAFCLGGPSEKTYASVDRYPQAQGNELSAAAWVYARSRPRWASIAKNWAGGDFDRGQLHFGLYNDEGSLEAHIVDSSGEEIIVKDSKPLRLNVWHHVAFVADGENIRLFLNGDQIDSKPYVELQKNPEILALAIGTKLNLAGDAPEERDFNMWDGYIDELAVFNHALTPDQLALLYEIGRQ